MKDKWLAVQDDMLDGKPFFYDNYDAGPGIER